MPVQLTLRSPKGGRVLTEHTYDDGYRIDAVSGWLVVLDRNGSTVAAHAACPGLEGAVVEYTSTTVGPAERTEAFAAEEDEHADATEEPVTAAVIAPDDEPGFPQCLANEARDDDDQFDENLLAHLYGLGNTYGLLGVALAAASLTDRRALIATLIDNRTRRPVPEDTTPPPVADHEACEEQADALRSEVARLSALLDQQRTTTVTLRGHLDRERARAEKAETETERLRRQLATVIEERDLTRDARIEAETELGRRRAEWDARATEGRQQVDRLVEANTELRQQTFSDAEALRDLRDLAQQRLDEANRLRDERDEQRALVNLYRHRYGSVLRWNVDDGPTPPAGEQTDEHRLAMPAPHGLASLSVAGPGTVTCDGRSLRVIYGDPESAGATMEGATVARTETTSPLALADEPRRPTLDHWPSDAVLLTYPELRRLVAVHLEACDTGQARAMLEGETPLRVSEVLS